MTDIKSLNYDELVTYMAGLGEKKFRASQLYQWMHEKLADSFDECTNLSNALRQKLKETSEYVCLEPVRVQHSKLDGTEKYLFRLSDGNYVESVLMKYHHGNSVCISSQVGCRMGCRFCASTLNGKVRDLRPSEMLDQIYRIQKITGERLHPEVSQIQGQYLQPSVREVRPIFLRVQYSSHFQDLYYVSRSDSDEAPVLTNVRMPAEERR